MRTSLSNRIRLVLAVVIMVGLLSAGSFAIPQRAAAQSSGPRIGVVCTTGTSPNPTFNLYATDGYIILGDANTMYMWSYSLGDQPQSFQHPGPMLCVNQGDTVTVILHNSLPEDVSIIFPGQENVMAGGVPSAPQFDGSGNVTSLTQVAPGDPINPANGGSMSYSFVATNPGTFIYESGTNPEKQVRMGLFGALIVRPSLGADFVYNRTDSQFTSEEEFVLLLSEIDPYQHQAAEAGVSFDLTKYHPRYWLVNGRNFPDTIADNFAPWVPSQPYGALARVHPYDPVNHPSPGLARYINVGSEEYPFHPHANNGTVVGRDGHPLEGPASQDLSFEKFAINIGPGQTWDVLFKWVDAESYDQTTNPVPVTIPDVANLTFGMFYSGSPYLGVQGPLPIGGSTLNQCGEYYIISHNHALYQLDAWGLTMAGQITYMRVDPPLPNSCP
jgi:FtsP/CotA-like multicopper oxidase with cupredoxin domain